MQIASGLLRMITIDLKENPKGLSLDEEFLIRLNFIL